jgi:hypothetical protein
MKGFLLKSKFGLFVFLTRQGGMRGLRAEHARRARHSHFIGPAPTGPIDVFYVGEKNFRATKSPPGVVGLTGKRVDAVLVAAQR